MSLAPPFKIIFNGSIRVSLSSEVNCRIPLLLLVMMTQAVHTKTNQFTDLEITPCHENKWYCMIHPNHLSFFLNPPDV